MNAANAIRLTTPAPMNTHAWVGRLASGNGIALILPQPADELLFGRLRTPPSGDLRQPVRVRRRETAHEHGDGGRPGERHRPQPPAAEDVGEEMNSQVDAGEADDERHREADHQ